MGGEKGTSLILAGLAASRSFLLANLLLIPIGLLAIKTGGYVVRVPRRVLLPVILLFCVIGSDGSLLAFFARPMAAACILLWLTPPLLAMLRRKASR